MKKIHIAFLAGIAAGILIAPRTGADSRAKVSEAGKKLGNWLAGKKQSNMYQDALNTIGEHIGAQS